MSKKVDISTLTNKELKLLIIKTITKRGLPKSMVVLLVETYSLIIMIDKGWFDDKANEAQKMAIKNITHVTGNRVIRPTEDE